MHFSSFSNYLTRNIIILKLLLKSNTLQVEWPDANVNYYGQYNISNKKLELGNKLNVTMKDFSFQSRLEGSIRVVVPQIRYNINSSEFFSNSISGSGASIYFVDTNADVTINNCTLQDQNATSHGGALYLNVKYSGLHDIKSLYSKSSQTGGFGYIAAPRSQINFSSFERSISSNGGGALYFTNGQTNNIQEIIGCYFGFCKSDTQGGAIMIVLSSISYVFMSENTFFNCESKSHGGAIYITSNALITDIKKQCISYCCINVSGAFQGHTIYIVGNSNQYQIKLNMITCSYCGVPTYSNSLLYILYGEQFVQGLNLSNNKADSKSIGHFFPHFASIYQHNNFINNGNNNKEYNLYFQTNGGKSIDLTFSNVIGNSGSPHTIMYNYGVANMFSIRYCILLSNIASTSLLGSLSTHTQLILGSYIVHSGTWNQYFSNENNIIHTSISTSTYILSHYSTYLCLTPSELGILEYNPSQNCQTIPPIPTSCDFATNNEQINIFTISNMLSLIFLQFFFF